MAPSSPKNTWLLKSEPDVYSFDRLLKDKRTNWDLVRNYQARNYLKQIRKGDHCLIYHSNEGKEIVGIAECVKEAYPDIDPEGGDWVQIDVKPVERFAQPVTLAQIKSTAALKDLLLIKQSRLSVMPVSAAHYRLLLKMGGVA